MSYTYEIFYNDENKIFDVLFNGKPVKRASMRGMRKAQETPYWFEYESGHIARNRFSGAEIFLNALEYSIYRWCVKWYELYSIGKNDTPIQTYDDMKYFLFELNSRAYMELID